MIAWDLGARCCRMRGQCSRHAGILKVGCLSLCLFNLSPQSPKTLLSVLSLFTWELTRQFPVYAQPCTVSKTRSRLPPLAVHHPLRTFEDDCTHTPSRPIPSRNPLTAAQPTIISHSYTLTLWTLLHLRRHYLLISLPAYHTTIMPSVLIHVTASSSAHKQPQTESMTRIQQDLAATSKISNHTNGSRKPRMFKRLATKGHKPRVAIVGAGFAGLRAADVLLTHGVDVTIFEARDRLGGRVSIRSPHILAVQLY